MYFDPELDMLLIGDVIITSNGDENGTQDPDSEMV